MKYTDIKSIKRREYNGITYGLYIISKSGRICDNIDYCVIRNGKTVVEALDFDRIPKYIKKFIATHKEQELDYKIELEGFKHYIIK